MHGLGKKIGSPDEITGREERLKRVEQHSKFTLKVSDTNVSPLEEVNTIHPTLESVVDHSSQC